MNLFSHNKKHLFSYYLSAILLLISCFSCVSDTKYVNSASELQLEDKNGAFVELLLDSNNVLDHQVKLELGKTLEYAKIPYAVVSIDDTKRLKLTRNTQVLVVRNIDVLPDSLIKDIIVFVAKGGTLVLTNNGESKKFGFLAGIPSGANYAYDNKASGFRFTKNLFNNKINQTYEPKERQFGLTGSNFTGIQVWAVAANDPSYPVIFQKKLGNGQVIVFNNSLKMNKQYRGLYFAAVMSGLQNVPWPVVSTASIFLDDFISPTYPSKREPVLTEFNVYEHEFVTKIWWPDMAEFAKKQSIQYTSVSCFDYRNNNKPPFTFTEWDRELSGPRGVNFKHTSGAILKQLKKAGHELGLHGYNHRSLEKATWPNQDFMKLSISTVQKKWELENYGELPYTYVPPSNVVDHSGLNAVKAGMPSIQLLSSLYLGDYKVGQGREYDWDFWNKNIFDFPRVTAGFIMNDNETFNGKSMFLYTGIWNHFVHPDDIFQIPEGSGLGKGDYEFRNKESRFWRKTRNGKLGLFPEFKQYVIQAKQDFPFMDFVSAKVAAERTKAWRQAIYQYTPKDEGLQVEQTNIAGNKVRVWFSYTPTQYAGELTAYLQKENIKFYRIPWLDGFMYQIKTKNPKLVLPNRLNFKPQNDYKLLVGQLLTNYDNYKSGKIIFKNILEELNYRIKNGENKEVVRLLKAKIASDPEFNVEDWDNLYKYMAWTNQTPEFWNVLENRYKSIPDDSILPFAISTGNTNGYPTELIQKYWLEQQLLANPKDMNLKAKYIAAYGLSSNVTATEVLALLHSSIPTKSKIDIVSLYLDLHPLETSFFDRFKPCTDQFMIPLADRIAYLYADSKKYPSAVAWGACTRSISKTDLTDWRILGGEYQFLKQEDYPRYVEYLLDHQPEEAVTELDTQTPRKLRTTRNLNTSISYLYSDKGQLRKALAWSEFADDIPVLTQLQWEYDLQAYQEMDKRFAKYISTHPEDEKVKKEMAKWLLYRGEIEKAWMLAITLKESEEKHGLLAELNASLMFQPLELKKSLMSKYKDFMDEKIRNKIQNELISNTYDAISINTDLVADRVKPTSIYSTINYLHKDRKFNTHTFGLTNYRGFALKLDQTYPYNKMYTSVGLEYGFESSKVDSKLFYSGKVGVEKGEKAAYLYHLKGNVSFSVDSLFSSFSFKHQPAITASAHYLKIYQSQLSFYEELQINNRYTAVFYLEGDLYDRGGKTAQAMLQLARKWKLGKYAKIAPYVEASGEVGNRDFTLGYPYWAIERRAYGGLGIGYSFENKNSHQKYIVDAGFFLDTYSDSFQRYKIQIQQPLWDRFWLTAGAEFYTIKDYYSNNLNAGVIYYVP